MPATSTTPAIAKTVHAQSWTPCAAIALLVVGLLGEHAALSFMWCFTAAGSGLLLASAGMFTGLMGGLLMGKPYSSRA